MARPHSVRLLDLKIEFERALDGEELIAARQVSLPTLTFERRGGAELKRELRRAGAFSAVVLEGMILRQVAVGDQLGMRLLGPGDLVLAASGPPPMLVAESHLRAIGGTRLALLGSDFLVAARRWPALFTALQLHAAEQIDRVTTQLVICQLPRVDQRLLALMWLLAESWGRVTPSGTTLPLRLTHDALGALIGARRPTVTLALRELADRGALVRQREGWLLLEPPPQSSGPRKAIQPPAVRHDEPARWQSPGQRDDEWTKSSFALLQETVAQLREQHARNTTRFREDLVRIRQTREHCRNSRNVIVRQRLSRRQPPSS